jgi:hypothetical protein
MLVVTPKVNRPWAQEPAQEIHSGLDIGLKGFRGFGIGSSNASAQGSEIEYVAQADTNIPRTEVIVAKCV